MPAKSLANLCGIIVFASLAMLSVVPAQAQPYISGTFDCVSIDVAGHATACTGPSIELDADGTYQVLAERGTYEIIGGHWLSLSTEKNHGRGRLANHKEIIFEFISGGKKTKITYRERYKRSNGWYSS